MIDPGPASPLLQLDTVSRQLAGREVVRALSLQINRGDVLGLLGINGAGKSTTLRLIAGVLAPSGGRVLLDGENLYENPHLARLAIGYLPERAPLHTELTVTEYLHFCARLRGLDRERTRLALLRELERCDLGDVRGRLIGNLSKGFQQRVGIAQALLHDPALIVLDEPASGLDPVQSLRMRELILSLRGQHGIVLSTHQLAEVGSCCDHIAILHRGELRYSAPYSASAGAELEQRFMRIATDAGEYAA